MADVLITNARIFDGSGALPFQGEVLIKGNRIAQVRRGGTGSNSYGSQQVIDAAGAFLMPEADMRSVITSTFYSVDDLLTYKRRWRVSADPVR